MAGFFDLQPNWRKYWKKMPSFDQKDLMPFQTVHVHFRNPGDRDAFAQLMRQKITPRTRFVWHPHAEKQLKIKRIMAETPMPPRYPVYIISKGRWESRLTSKALEKIGVPYHIVVEPQEYDHYASVIDKSKILTLPFSNLGQGSIPARNWVWEHAVSRKAARHWILDDNIRKFYRLLNNRREIVACPNIFRPAEDFVDRFENVALAGFQYSMFATDKDMWPAFALNTRIYSCILIKNDIPHRWRGRYNEDTDLSLRALKDGWCTVLFWCFLAEKMATMTMKGGNTDELYRGSGRYEMAKALLDQHPDVVTINQRWERWQHVVDYTSFRKNKLKPKYTAADFSVDEPDEYSMYLGSSEEEESLSKESQDQNLQNKEKKEA